MSCFMMISLMIGLSQRMEVESLISYYFLADLGTPILTVLAAKREKCVKRKRNCQRQLKLLWQCTENKEQRKCFYFYMA